MHVAGQKGPGKRPSNSVDVSVRNALGYCAAVRSQAESSAGHAARGEKDRSSHWRTPRNCSAGRTGTGLVRC